MSAGAPWSVKGIDPKAREIAKDLARRSGMTLGEWLNQMILEGDGEEDNVTPLPRRTVAYAGFDRRARGRRLDDTYDLPGYDEGDTSQVGLALEALTARIEAAERRSTLAISGVSQAVNGLLGRLEDAEASQAVHTEKLGELLGDVRDSHDRLRRLERDAQGPRSTEALKALEGALGKIANQLYEGEARTRATLTEMREDVGGLTRRLTRMEAEERATDATLMEGAVAKITERLERAESQTAGALRTLETSFAHLDARLRAAEGKMDPERDARIDGRLESLAGDLSRQVEAARADLFRRIDEAASQGRFDKLERAVGDLAAHVGAAEKRSAAAVERMGHEVLRIGQNLNRRMTGVESASAAAVQKAGVDVARLAEAMEGRLRRAEAGQGEALERLGAEISRISERFTEKLAHAERRAALADEDVAERVGRLADKVEARYERASGELAERIRESEERTARLLEEARLKIEAQIDQQARRRRPEPETPAWEPEPEAAFPAAAGSDMGFDPIFDAPQAGFGAELAPEFPEDPFSPAEAAATAPLTAFDDFGGDDEFASSSPVAAPFQPDEDPAPPCAPVSTREAIEAARAAARLGVRNVGGGSGLSGLKLGSKTRLHERVEKERRRESSTLRKTLLASSIGVTLISTAAAYQLVTAETAEDEALAQAAAAPQPMIAAVAIAPGLGQASPDDEIATAALYADASERLQAGDPTGLKLLHQAANRGYAEAQYHLGVLYMEGGAGLGVDLAEARRWTQRAAEGGYTGAMYNLGALLANEGDSAGAVNWFRKAAERGHADSQYNLAVMLEHGRGVAADPIEAYKWYLISKGGGEDEALTDAIKRVGGQLGIAELRAARRAAAAFHAVADEPVEIAAR